MLGLVLKDIYMVWNYCRAVVLVCIAFLISSLFVDEIVFFTIYPIIISGIIPFSLLVYEEKFKWAPYCQSFPVTRAQVVSAKYLLSLGCVFLAVVLSIVFAVIKGFVAENAGFPDLSMVLATLPIAFVGPAIMLPFVFKYDVEKARLVYYVVVGGICGLSAFISVDGGNTINVSNGVLLLSAIAMFIISWVISVKIYENKEL